MAGSSILSRLSSSRLPSLSLKLRTKKSIAPTISPLLSSSQSHVSSSVKRISRLPVELSCLMSMMPLYSAVASARLQSLLSVDSQSWCVVPQGLSLSLLLIFATVLINFISIYSLFESLGVANFNGLMMFWLIC